MAIVEPLSWASQRSKEMFTVTEEVVSLKKTDAGNLASNERMMVVGELERELLRKMRCV